MRINRVARAAALPCVCVVLAVGLAVLPAGSMAAGQAASHAAATPATGQPAPGRLSVAVHVNRFASSGRRTTATATATATLTNFSGQATSVRQQVTLSAATGGSCKVLHLFLQQLDLNLLGLHAHLDKVILDITGQQHGGVLGALFCRLARGASVSPARAAADARALSAELNRHRMRALRFSASLTPKAADSQAPAPVCQVLDLVLGPLNLVLLGLQVDLNQLHLVQGRSTPSGSPPTRTRAGSSSASSPTSSAASTRRCGARPSSCCGSAAMRHGSRRRSRRSRPASTTT